MKSSKVMGATHIGVSHPSRGAWIEIAIACLALLSAVVAPLTGCVD